MLTDVSETDTKLITPMDAESRRLFDWMEKGVYDALQRKYLKTLIFCIGETEDDGPMIEKYGLSFSYSDSGSQEVIIRTENKKHGGASSSNQRRTSACQMVRTLAELMRNLDKMPDKRTIELTTTVDATKSPQDLYSAGKVSPGGSFDAGVAETYAFIDSVLKDNKCEFVSLLKRHFVGEDLESERSQALKLLSACCGYDALNCASSIINGYLRSVPYINDIAADTGLSPLHTAAEANSPRCVEMLLKRRARTDMRSKDERALLPLELSLCNGSLEVPWNPSGDSIADLILLLVDKDLTVVKLLAEKTKDVDVVAHAFARAGAILPFTALLIVESDKIREATVALQDDDSASKSGKLTIYESLIQEAIQMQSVRSQKRMLLLREIELLQLFGAAVFSDIGNEQTSLISIVQVRLGYLSL